MGTTIRHARGTDAGALRELDMRLWSPLVTPATREELAKPFFCDECGPSDAFVAERDGRPVGYVQLCPPTPLVASRHVLELRGLMVDPDHRRRGIATRLLRAAEQEAARRGVRRLTLRVLAPNAQARALYEARGYVVEGILRGEFRLDGGYVDDVLMAADVPPSDSASPTG